MGNTKIVSGTDWGIAEVAEFLGVRYAASARHFLKQHGIEPCGYRNEENKYGARYPIVEVRNAADLDEVIRGEQAKYPGNRFDINCEYTMLKEGNGGPIWDNVIDWMNERGKDGWKLCFLDAGHCIMSRRMPITGEKDE